jgi:hypothetical protein
MGYGKDQLAVDHIAHSSTRVQGTCMLTGEAAGTASAMCRAAGNIPLTKLDVSSLQKNLLKKNVFLDYDT